MSTVVSSFCVFKRKMSVHFLLYTNKSYKKYNIQTIIPGVAVSALIFGLNAQYLLSASSLRQSLGTSAKYQAYQVLVSIYPPYHRPRHPCIKLCDVYIMNL